jgi:hypothetical protein
VSRFTVTRKQKKNDREVIGDQILTRTALN